MRLQTSRLLCWVQSAGIGLLVSGLGTLGMTQELNPQRVGVGKTQKKLSLEEALELALANNLEVQIQKSESQIVRQGVQAAKGAFDPTFRWQPLIESRNLPTGSSLLGQEGKSTDHIFTQNFYFQQKLPWAGSSFRIDFENFRQSTNNPFAGLNPYFNSRLFFNFAQPLWRNRDLDRPRAELRIRRKESEIADTDFELKVINIVTQVALSYWNLAEARWDVQVNSENVKLARELLAQNQRMVEAGMLPPLEISGSKAELERRLDNLYYSIGVVTAAENVLKSLLAPNREVQFWEEEIITEDTLLQLPAETPELSQAVAKALSLRPELVQDRLRKETNAIQKQFNSSQTKPQVDLLASYGNSGLAGKLSTAQNPFAASNDILYGRVNELSDLAGLPPLQPPTFAPLPDFLLGNYWTALSNVFSGRFQTLAGGFSIDLNLRNRTAQANLAQSMIAERQLNLESTRLEQVIEVQVRNALQGLQTSRQRIVAADASAEAARQKLDSENRLFQSGESTNFLVLTRQNELTDSRRRQVAARADFNRSVARYEQALGVTLGSHNITLK